MLTDRLRFRNIYLGNIHRGNEVLKLAPMDTKTNRYLNLRQLIRIRFNGNAGKCADALGIKRPQMSRWVTENESARQGIAEESARSIEKKLGLRRGSMDGHPELLEEQDAAGHREAVERFSWIYASATDKGRELLDTAMKHVSGMYIKEDRRQEAIPVVKDRRH